MRYLTLTEILELHNCVLEQAGGMPGIRDMNALDSVVAQPTMTFGGEDLYSTVIDKAAALAFSLIMNHPFVDGNKRAGHAAMETFLVMNGHEIEASIEEQEQVILNVAAGKIERPEFNDWLRSRVKEKP